MALSSIEFGDATENALSNAENELDVQAGIATVEIYNNQLVIKDLVTTYHPAAEVIPGYRYVVQIVKLANVTFNVFLIMNADDWQGAPLVPDFDYSSNSAAKQPKMKRAELTGLVDSLSDEAILTDRKFIKDSIQVAIASNDPDRINVALTVKLTGNGNKYSTDLNFGFFYGQG